MRTLSSLLGEPRAATMLTVFATHGLVVGSLFSRIAELQTAIGLGEGELGIALIGLPAGVLVASLLASRLIEQIGTRPVLLGALPSFAAALVLTSLAFNLATLFAAILLFGLALGSCNIAMNVESDRVEAATGRRVINRCHGNWAVGFLVASLVGTAAVAIGLPPTFHFVIIFLVVGASAMFVVAPMEPSPPRAHRSQGRRRRFFAMPTRGVLRILGFAVGGIVLEGTTRSWSIIYLRDDFAALAWVTTLSLPSIIITQITGRFLADRMIERFGPVRVGVALTGISFAGLATIVLAQSIPVALVGFLMIGFGISTTHPQAFSAAARLGDRPSSENLAALATLQTVIGFATPPVFGFIASRYGIRASFALILPLPLIALYFARALKPPQ